MKNKPCRKCFAGVNTGISLFFKNYSALEKNTSVPDTQYKKLILRYSRAASAVIPGIQCQDDSQLIPKVPGSAVG